MAYLRNWISGDDPDEGLQFDEADMPETHARDCACSGCNEEMEMEES